MAVKRSNFHRKVTYAIKKILFYSGGDEKATTIVVDPATVTADSRGIKSLPAGALLVKMTSGANIGAYGPYAAGATDGRQTLGVAPNCVILTDEVDLTVDAEQALYRPTEIGGYFADCMFDESELTLYSATSNAVKTAFPMCHFF